MGVTGVICLHFDAPEEIVYGKDTLHNKGTLTIGSATIKCLSMLSLTANKDETAT